MSGKTTHNENSLVAYLAATAEQLDIASEDVEIALSEVLETFEAAANCMEVLEGALNSDGDFDRQVLLDVVVKMRTMLRSSVISLQFQDRLSQRLALASRELRQAAAENSVADFHFPESDLKVPKSVSSLYNQQQMIRIIRAAGSHSDVIESAGDEPGEDQDIELF